MEDRSPVPSKKFSMENGADEEASCLRKKPGALQGLRERFMTESQLGARAKIGIAVLIMICIILLLAVIIMGVTLPKRSNSNVCNTSKCLSVAADIVGKADIKSPQCEDNWKWACGQWVEDNKDKLQARGEWTLTEEMKQSVLLKLKDKISTMTSPAGQINSINWKLKNLFDSCMNIDLINSEGSLHLQKIINELGGWHVLLDWSPLEFDVSHALELLHTRYGSQPLFSVSVIDEAAEPPSVLLAPSGLGLPDRSFYYSGFDNKAITAYKRLLKDAALLLGATTANARIFADDVLNYERRLAELMKDRNESNSTTVTTVTLQQLTTEAHWLPIKNILNAMFPRANFTNSTNVHLQSPFYIKRLNGVLYGADRGILNDYLIWQVVKQYLPYMSNDFRVMWQTYLSEITGAETQLPLWEFCTNVIYNTAPIAVMGILENEDKSKPKYSNLTLSAVDDIFRTLKSTVMKLIADSDKITHAEKENLMNNVATLNLKIGLLDEIDDGYLKEYHSKLFVQKGNFFENVGYGLNFQKELMQNTIIDKEFGRKRSLLQILSGMEVKYEPFAHVIAVPRILSELPYYDAFYPRSVQYARLGVPIAREILVAITFENYGMKTEIFKQMELCVLEALKTTLSSASLAGSLHMTAVDIAVKAIKVRLQDSYSFVEDYRDVGLPGLDDYDEIKTFALVYGQTQCSLASKQKMTLNTLSGKVDGKNLFQLTWPQIKQFVTSFNCQRFPACISVF